MTLFWLAYAPFLQPLPGIWSDGLWMLLLLPLCAAVAIVYKSIKCRSMRDVPREAASTAMWILIGMVVAAVVLVAVVKGVEYWHI